MKKISYIIIIILIVLNITLVYKIKSNNNEFATVYSLLNKKLDKNKTKLLTFEQNFIQENKNENLDLDGNLPLIDITGKIILTKEIIKSNSLVFRFSETNCEECIDAEINALVKNKDKIKKDIILIAYYHNQRDFFVFYKNCQSKGLTNIKMYLLPNKALLIPLDRLNIPYYFCVNSNLKMNNFFIPQREKPKLSQIYLDYRATNLLN